MFGLCLITCHYGFQQVDCKLKPGDTQCFYFRKGDPPPFYNLQAPKEDVTTTKRNRKGDTVTSITEGYINKPKGA